MNYLESAFFKNMNLRNDLQLDLSKNKEHIFKNDLKTCIIQNVINGKENFQCYNCKNRKHLIKDTLSEINKEFTSNLKIENKNDGSFDEYQKFKVNYNNIPTNEIGLSDTDKKDLIIYSETLFNNSINHRFTRKQLEEKDRDLDEFSIICSNLYNANNSSSVIIRDKTVNFFNSILKNNKIVHANIGFGNNIEKK